MRKPWLRRGIILTAVSAAADLGWLYFTVWCLTEVAAAAAAATAAAVADATAASLSTIV